MAMSDSTSLFEPPEEARLGSLGLLPFLPCPPLPNMVAEWAAVIPLITHLATPRDDYNMVGDVALRGHLSVGLFPPLGALSGMANLLHQGTEFLDAVSIRGGSSRVVWDVRWGSVFPCVNGGACAAVSRELLSQREKLKLAPVRMPERLNASRSKDEIGEKHDKPADSGYRRYQTLVVYNLQPTSTPRPRMSTRQQLTKMSRSGPFRILHLLGLVGLGVVMCLFGTYGTAAIVLLCAASEAALALTGLASVRLPPKFSHKIQDARDQACMLVAPHNNAMEWHLFIGHCGVVDSLLNKPMFLPPQPGAKKTRLVATWLRTMSVLQLGAMTFVAAQRGWDGVLLCALMFLSRGASGFSRGRFLARDFLAREGIEADVGVFEFGSRNAMMGAIQLFSGSSTTRWMDDIIVPHPRRDAFLRRIRGELPSAEEEQKLGPRDSHLVGRLAEATLAAADVLESQFGQDKTLPAAAV
jgi:hypothetical protein